MGVLCFWVRCPTQRWPRFVGSDVVDITHRRSCSWMSGQCLDMFDAQSAQPGDSFDGRLVVEVFIWLDAWVLLLAVGGISLRIQLILVIRFMTHWLPSPRWLPAWV